MKGRKIDKIKAKAKMTAPVARARVKEIARRMGYIVMVKKSIHSAFAQVPYELGGEKTSSILSNEHEEC